MWEVKVANRLVVFTWWGFMDMRWDFYKAPNMGDIIQYNIAVGPAAVLVLLD